MPRTRRTACCRTTGRRRPGSSRPGAGAIPVTTRPGARLQQIKCDKTDPAQRRILGPSPSDPGSFRIVPVRDSHLVVGLRRTGCGSECRIEVYVFDAFVQEAGQVLGFCVDGLLFLWGERA
ncbi:hypothetical protein GCM10010431_62640 [Streptomyces kunmingensis]